MTSSYCADEDYPAGPETSNLSLNEATYVAQNRPLCRLMSTFGTTQHTLLVVHAIREEYLYLCYHSIARDQSVHTNECRHAKQARLAVANPQTKPADLSCESTCRLPSSTPAVAIYYYY